MKVRSSAIQIAMNFTNAFARLLIRRYKHSSTFGWNSRIRSNSEPPYPEPPKIPTESVLIFIRVHRAHTRLKRSPALSITISNKASPSRRAFAAGTLNCVLM
jgi:hypothetical protein